LIKVYKCEFRITFLNRGPNIEAEIEAEIEADIEAGIEAGIEADIEAEIEAEIEAGIEAGNDIICWITELLNYLKASVKTGF
jgi:hypothetical protein